MNHNTNEYIKTFLKIEKTEENIYSSFSIDKNQKIFSLYSPDNIKLDFDLDKIFTDNDENSDIYQIICQNCVQEFIERTNYSFISFGETVSKKYEFLVGNIKEDYSNAKNYGILIRFLDELLTKKNKQVIGYIIKFSNFLVFENNLIDLTYFGGKNKKGYEIDLNIFLSNAYKINNDPNIINKMNKINLEKFNDIIMYLHYIHKFLFKLNRERIYNKFNICFVIYLFDEHEKEIISTISFIILLGSENLSELSNNKQSKFGNNINILEKNKSIKSAKSSIETRNIFNSIINSISNNNSIQKLKTKKNTEEESISKITTVLNNICFDKNISNIKFRIIGNIKPIKSYYHHTKDVLIFLFDCWKILNSKIEIKDKIKNENRKENVQFDLEYKIKEQKNEINNLKRKIEKLNKKIEFLDCNYQKQISVIKSCFEFDGDINMLLAGNENSKEMQYVKNYKNCQNLINNYKETQENLEKNLKVSGDEIKILKTKLNSRKEQEDMIKYYLTAQQSIMYSKKNKEEKEKYNVLNKKIEELIQQIKNKDKIISELQKELDKKSKIIFSITDSSKNWKNEIKIKCKNNNENKENKMNEYKQELENMKINEEKLRNEFKNKYNSMLMEKENELFDERQKYGKSVSDANQVKSELIKIYRIFKSFILYINNNKSNFSNNKEQLDKLIIGINNEIIEKNFPNLFNELKEKNINILDKEDINDKEKAMNKKNININEFIKKRSAKDILIEELKEKNKLLCLTFDIQVKKNNNNLVIINSQKRTIEKLEKEIDSYKQILLKKKVLSNDDLILNKNVKENILLKKSLSFKNNNLLKKEKPYVIKRNERTYDIYSYDSFRQKTKNSTHINNFSSYQNTIEKFNKKSKNVKELILIQKKIKNVSKNQRPFSVGNETKNNFIFTTN